MSLSSRASCAAFLLVLSTEAGIVLRPTPPLTNESCDVVLLVLGDARVPPLTNVLGGDWRLDLGLDWETVEFTEDFERLGTGDVQLDLGLEELMLELRGDFTGLDFVGLVDTVEEGPFASLATLLLLLCLERLELGFLGRDNRSVTAAAVARTVALDGADPGLVGRPEALWTGAGSTEFLADLTPLLGAVGVVVEDFV